MSRFFNGFDSNVFLAPMAGITDKPLRRLTASLGGGNMVSEMVAVNAVQRKNPKTYRIADVRDEPYPVVVQLVGNNPSIVLYAMNHNATGYEGDQNPLAIDGKQMPKVWNDATRRKALEVAGRIKQMDPSRVIYNHSSGDLGECYTLNIYLNWSPIQERSDWLEHWNKEGRKPVIFVEWGMPHVSSFSNYRGPQFIWTKE